MKRAKLMSISNAFKKKIDVKDYEAVLRILHALDCADIDIFVLVTNLLTQILNYENNNNAPDRIFSAFKKDIHNLKCEIATEYYF